MSVGPNNLHLMPAPHELLNEIWPEDTQMANELGHALDDNDSAASRLVKRSMAESMRAHPSNMEIDTDHRWAKLALEYANPKNSTVPFAQLCAKVGVSWREVITHFMDYQRAIGMMAVAAQTPIIMQELTEDARKGWAPCGKCKGRKEVRKGRGSKAVLVECPSCQGEGRIRIQANAESREQVLSIAGVLNNGKNAPVVIQQNFGVPVEDTVRDITAGPPVIHITPEPDHV